MIEYGKNADAFNANEYEYDYRAHVLSDIIDAVAEDIDNLVTFETYDEAYEHYNENFWIDDGVTGNASGSYTFSTYKAECYLAYNMDLLVDALYEFGDTAANALERGAEYCDVTIRCYLLGECLSEVLDNLDDYISLDDDMEWPEWVEPWE